MNAFIKPFTLYFRSWPLHHFILDAINFIILGNYQRRQRLYFFFAGVVATSCVSHLSIAFKSFTSISGCHITLVKYNIFYNTKTLFFPLNICILMIAWM